jgi:uncharacterized protein
MNGLEFEWNPLKDEANQRKHGISFEEAESAFYDEYARLIPDPDHSIGEERFLLLGVIPNQTINVTNRQGMS